MITFLKFQFYFACWFEQMIKIQIIKSNVDIVSLQNKKLIIKPLQINSNFLNTSLVNQSAQKSMNSRKQRKPLPYSPKTFILNRQNQGSPTKATVLLQEQNIEYIDALINQKQNLCTCLDLYTVSYQNQLPQKCLLHSNFITLYCENQYKLLCVNCIYNSAAHKQHRVVPSKNSINNISRDNDENMKVLDEQIDRIKYAEQELKNNRRKLEQEYKNILKQLDQEFNAMQKLLNQKYESTKKRVIENFQRAAVNNQTSSKQVNWWRQTLINTRGSLPKASKNEQAQIFKHLVLGLFMEDKIDLEKLTYIASDQQMRNEFLSEIIQLRQLIETQIGEIADLINKGQKGASRRLGVF